MYSGVSNKRVGRLTVVRSCLACEVRVGWVQTGTVAISIHHIMPNAVPMNKSRESTSKPMHISTYKHKMHYMTNIY